MRNLLQALERVQHRTRPHGIYLPALRVEQEGESMNEEEIKTPLRTIRAYCLECVGGSSNEVRFCPCPECQLHPYRFGKRPSTISKHSQDPKRTRTHSYLDVLDQNLEPTPTKPKGET